MKFENVLINNEKNLYFIADIGANHDGDINRAFKLIELAKKAGADAAKFQNFVADKIVSKKGFSELNTGLSHQKNWAKPVYEIYKDAEVSYEWTHRLKKKCDEVGIEYFTSPYDFESVDAVDKYVNIYKIGSGDITWIEIIQYIAKKGKPIIIASGASSLEDVDRAMTALKKITNNIVLMQCNTNYTANIANYNYINLNVLQTYKQKYPDLILGLSDHTTGNSTVLGAVALGARVFEKHFTDDNSRSGPDHKFAMNPSSWTEMIERAKEVYMALGDGIKKVEENEKETSLIQRRSLRFTKNLQKGHKICEGDLFPLRPFQVDAIQPYMLSNFIGKILTKDVIADDYLRRKDIE